MTLHRLPFVIVAVATLLLSGACGSTDSTNDGAKASGSPEPPPATIIDYTKVDDRGAVLRKAEDVSRLRGAPDDFKHFMAGVVDTKVNSFEPDPDCPFFVTVRKLDAAGFAEGGYISCGGNAELWAKKDGVWREIYAGQEAPDCPTLKEYSVPPAIAGDQCFDEDSKKNLEYTG